MTIDSANITLIPTQATLSFAHSLSAATARSIVIDCDLEPGTDVRLPSERTLKNAHWMASITEAIAYNDHATEQGAIGFLKYGPESQRADDHSPETCYASVALKPECFCTLLSALQAGRLPKSIHIEAKGMEFGWKPDGSGVVWNVNSASTLPIVDIRFNVPLIADLQPLTPSSPFEIPVVSDRHPSTTYDIKSLERTLISVLQKLETRFSRIGVSVIAVAVLLLLFRH